MALEPFRTAESSSSTAAAPAAGPPSAPAAPALPILRFGLRHLFWTVTAFCLLCATVVANLHGPTPLVLLLAAIVIAAHVAATALGSRLRRHADEARDWEKLHGARATPTLIAAEHSCNLATTMLPPPSPWYLRGSTSLSWLPKWIIAGSVLGGSVGIAVFLTEALGHRASLAGIFVGAISLAVVGGWLAFLSGSFYAILRHGLREAMAHQQKDESQISTRR